MIAVSFRAVGFAYDGEAPALVDVDLDVPTGDVLLVVGASGSGKSTLLRAVNGLVPHSSGGQFRGSVVVGGRSTHDHRPRDLADTVGFVHQDPEAQFVVDEVEHDIAFALENLGMEPAAMRRRVEEVLDALGIAHLRHRSPTTLSGGERQRAAVAGALAAAPDVLVLDEPTSELDPQGADDVLAAIARLNADLGTTVLLAEHRLERAAPLGSLAARIDDGFLTGPAEVAALLAGYDGAPPVTHLGRLLGWDPPPLTVRDARRLARATPVPERRPHPPAPAAGETLVEARGLHLRLGGHPALRGVDLDIRRGEVVALLGRNGSGKTTLLRLCAGLAEADRGTIDRSARVAYLPQDPNALLFAPSVREEFEHTLRLLGRADPDAVATWLTRLGLADLADRHPRSLSAGQRQRVAIGAVAVGGAEVLLLDEPTRGIDPPSAAALEQAVAEHAAVGGAVVLATHDVELAARCATRAVVLGDGEVVASGSARDVLAGSLFAPQVLRVLPPYLTVAEVAEALER